MIDENTEHKYNIILSIFLGILAVFVLSALFDRPRIIDIYNSENNDQNE